MTKEQISAFADSIRNFEGKDLDMLIDLVNEKIIADYNKKENFMLHNSIDQYLYIVDYLNGEFHYYCKGNEAYERYVNDDDAYQIRRKTKDLFPVYDTLMRKEHYEQERLRYRVCQNAL